MSDLGSSQSSSSTLPTQILNGDTKLEFSAEPRWLTELRNQLPDVPKHIPSTSEYGIYTKEEYEGIRSVMLDYERNYDVYSGIRKDLLRLPTTSEPSTLQKRILRAIEVKNRRIRHRRELLERYYTDIFAHSYDLYNGTQLAIGTSQGNLSIIRHEQSGSPHLEDRFPMFGKKPIKGLQWGIGGICLISGKFFRLHKTTTENMSVDPKPSLTFMTPTDIVSVCNFHEHPERIALVCGKGKTRVYDINTQKLLHVFADHKAEGTVCRSKGNFFVTGGLDGNVFAYDASLRTVEPVYTISQATPITTVALSESATYIAIARKGLNIPSMYNLRARFPVGGLITMPDKLEIKALALGDHGDTYWGGTNGVLYSSDCCSTVPRKMEACYGQKRIRCIYSIALPPNKDQTIDGYVSIAGDSNSVLISSRGCKYWAHMIHMVNESSTKAEESILSLA